MVACGAWLTVIDRLSISDALADRTRLVALEPARWVSFGIILPAGGGLDGPAAQFAECLKAELAARHEKGWVALARGVARSDERSVGKECDSKCRTRWSKKH